MLSADTVTSDLFAAISRLWPSFLALILSFFVVLVMWVNHHELFRLVKRVDHPFPFANGFVLLMVTFVLFPTAVLAQYIRTPAMNAAAAFYCGTFFVGSIAFNLLWATIAHHRRLLRPEIDDEVLARVRRANWSGMVAYALSTAVALWSATGGLAICVSLWLVWTRSLYRVKAHAG